MRRIRQVTCINSDADQFVRIVGEGVVTRHNTVQSIDGKDVPYVYWTVTIVPEEETYGPTQPAPVTPPDDLPSVPGGETRSVREQAPTHFIRGGF